MFPICYVWSLHRGGGGGGAGVQEIETDGE